MTSREESLIKLREATIARQKFLDMMYARAEAEEAQRMSEEEQKQIADDKNWLDEGFQGMNMGGSAGGAWGALAGAIIGTVAGQKKAYDARRKEGKGKWESFWRTHFDTPLGTSKFNKTNMADASGGGGAIYNQYQRNKAEKSTAADQKKRNQDWMRENQVTGQVAMPNNGRARMSVTPRESYQNYDIVSPARVEHAPSQMQYNPDDDYYGDYQTYNTPRYYDR